MNKLNHTVVRPDTPQIRGIVAAVPHLLEIVPEPVAPAWASIPEYTVHAPAAAPVKTVVVEPVAAEAVASEPAVTEKKPAKPRKQKKSAPEGSEPAEAVKE